jgi:endoglucanase
MKGTRMDLTALLKRLSNAQGIAGHEEPICEMIVNELKPFVDQVRINKLGNVIGLKQGCGPEPRRSIMLAAHMDEIGLMVSGIEKGFLRLAKLGGIDKRVLPGQPILVHGRKDLPGVIGFRPPHVLPPDKRDKVVPLEELLADVGLPAGQVEKWVRIGDVISFRSETVALKNGILAGKAFDNRASVAAMIFCMEALTMRRPQWNALAVATIQEETRLLGAAVSAYELNPDAAIAIDVTFSTQFNVSESQACELGKGPSIAMGPNMHPHLTQRLIDTAKRLEMPYQIETAPGSSGTDAWAIQVAREGIPTGVIGVPARYLHTPVETLSVQDVERCGRLLAEFVSGLDEALIKALTYEA